jgi:hypothetical protein
MNTALCQINTGDVELELPGVYKFVFIPVPEGQSVSNDVRTITKASDSSNGCKASKSLPMDRVTSFFVEITNITDHFPIGVCLDNDDVFDDYYLG